jgi:hypothetical protein
VINAFNSKDGINESARPAIAAALRAVADQVLPEEWPPYDACMEYLHRCPGCPPPWDVRAKVKSEFLAIANELDLQP